MRVHSVTRTNTQQKQKPAGVQNAGAADAVKTAQGSSFGEYLKSYYQQKPPQRKPRLSEAPPEEEQISGILSESALCAQRSNQIDITR